MAKIPDGTWYDDGNLDQMHRDLEADYPTVLGKLMDRPAMRRHVQDCPRCAEIAAQRERIEPPSPRRRGKFVIKQSQMAQILDLPKGAEVIFMYATMDPNTVQVIVSIADLPEIPEEGSSPILNYQVLGAEQAA